MDLYWAIELKFLFSSDKEKEKILKRREKVKKRRDSNKPFFRAKEREQEKKHREKYPGRRTEMHREALKKDNALNPDRIARERKRTWSKYYSIESNKKKILEKKREYREKFSDIISERFRKWNYKRKLKSQGLPVPKNIILQPKYISNLENIVKTVVV